MKMLAIQPGAIGDLILSLPTLRWLRQRFGGEGMEIWCERATVPLVKHPAYADRARPLAETGLDSYPLPARTLHALESFDLVVSWRGANLLELVAAVAAVQPHAHFLPQFPAPGQRLHFSDFRRTQLRSLFGEVGDFPAHPEIFLNHSDTVLAEDYLAKPGAGGRPVAVIHPGASSRRKQWGAGKFGALAGHLVRQWDAHILLCEGPLDADVVEAVMTSAPGLVARRMHTGNLRLLAAVLSRCHLFIGNDTGVTHLAAALALPTVAIFQDSDPHMWAPRGKAVQVLQRPSLAEAADAVGRIFEPTHARAG